MALPDTRSPARMDPAALFAALTVVPGSTAPDQAAAAVRPAGQQHAGTGGISEAETALKLMLMAGRHLSGRTLGIIGFGRTGREIAHRARLGFAMEIVIHSRSNIPVDELDRLGATQVDDLDRLLARSDFVSLHCPARGDTRHLIDALRLNRMKPDAYLINAADSGLVDEEALADALWHDTIAGAGLDMSSGKTAICDRLKGCHNLAVLYPPGPQASQFAS